MSYSQRIGASYLREVSGKGQGGFGLHVRGRVRFDSPFINDMTVAGTAAYDVRLGASGQPEFVVAAGPSARTTECTTCPRGTVHDDTVRSLREAAPELNTIISECMAAPVATAAPCEDVGTWGSTDCASSLEASLMAAGASGEVHDRGGIEETVIEFRKVVQDPQNWRCAPVSQQCSGMLGLEATAEPACQFRLTAVDLIPMTGKVSVVWHPAEPFSLPPTTGQALYLAAVHWGLTDVLDLLCSPRHAVDVHSFFRMDR